MPGGTAGEAAPPVPRTCGLGPPTRAPWGQQCTGHAALAGDGRPLAAGPAPQHPSLGFGVRPGRGGRCWASPDPLPCPHYASACSCGLASKGQGLPHTCDCHSHWAADRTLTTEPTTATPPWSVGPSSQGGLNTDQPRGCTGLRCEARSRPAGRGHAAHSLVALGPPGTGDGPFCGREVAPVYTFAVIGTSGSSASSAVAAGHPCSRWSVGPQGLLPFRCGPIFVTIWPGRGEGALKMGRTLKLRVRTWPFLPGTQ